MRTHTSIVTEDRDRPRSVNERSVNQQHIPPEEDHQLELKWYSLRSKVAKMLVVGPNTDKLQQSIPYEFRITKIGNIKVQPKKPYCELIARLTVFMADRERMSPFSNTAVCTVSTPLVQDRKGIYALVDPFSIFYHSRMDRNSKNLSLIVEIAVLETTGPVEDVYPIGFTTLNPFVESKQKVQQVKKGVWLQQDQETPVADLRYTLSFYLELKQLCKVIPPETIVTSLDEIPCLLGQALVNARPDIQLATSTSLRIEEFYIFIPGVFEEQIIRNFEKGKDCIVKNYERGSTKCQIKTRRIRYGFHNGWKLVNEGSKVLQPQGPAQQGTVTYQVVSDPENLEIEVWKGVGGVFLIVLVYDLAVSNKDGQFIHSVEVAICLRAFSLRDSTQTVRQEMLKGPGFGIDGKLLKIYGDKVPSINFEYSLVERRHSQHHYSEIRRSIHEAQSRQLYEKEDVDNSFVGHQRQLTQELERLEEEKQMLEEERQNLLNQMRMKEMKSKEEAEAIIEKQRLAQLERQQKLENMYREQISQITKDKLNYEMELAEIRQRVELLAQQREKEKIQHEEDLRRTLAQQQNKWVKLDPEAGAYEEVDYVKPARNKREAQISQGLYQSLEKRINIPKQLRKPIQVDPSEYENFGVASKFTINFLNISWLVDSPPRLFYFIVRFFNLAGFRTDSITYLQTGRRENLKLVKEAYFMYNQEQMEPRYEFEVDPSLSSNPKQLHKDLVDYLAQKKAILDIFDAQTHLYLGQLSLRLDELLRGKRQQSISAKQYPIIFEGIHYGSIQIVLTNQEITCKREIIINTRTKGIDRRNKVVSNHPIVIPADETKLLYKNQRPAFAMTQQNRIEERIKMFKQKKLLQNAVKAPSDTLSSNILGQTDHMFVIQQIQQYKKRQFFIYLNNLLSKKPEYIRQIYTDFLNEHKTISSYFGKAEVFTYQFVNMQDKPNSYKLQLQDPDEGILQTPELFVVKQPLEWRYFCETKGYALPKSFDIISENNIFYLHPGQTITILFKFISFRGQKTHAEANPRILNCLVVKQNNSRIVGGFSLKVEPHQQVVDQSYIFYENADEPVEIILPVLYSSNKMTPTASKPLLIATDPSVQATWISEYEIAVQLVAPSIMDKVNFNILLYQDQYMFLLKQNWHIEITGYEAVSITAKPNTNVRFRLAVPQTDTNQKVKLFASHEAVQFEDDYRIGFSLAEGSLSVINGVLKCNSNEFQAKKMIIAHCVSVEDLRLLYGWRIQVVPWSNRKNFQN